MATIEKFLKSGELGSVFLGKRSRDAIEEWGEPDKTSRKMNPLILYYGPIQLTFIKSPSSEGPRLHDILIALNVSESDTSWSYSSFSKVLLEDFSKWEHLTRSVFLKRSSEIGCSLVGEGANRIELASGVVALFNENCLQSLRLSKRDTVEASPKKIADGREPTIQQICGMIAESRIANDANASRAALLIIWAALEALLRRVMLERKIASRVDVSPHNLIRDLSNARFLTPDEMRLLEEARQARMVVAHGLAALTIRETLFDELIALAKSILARLKLTERDL